MNPSADAADQIVRVSMNGSKYIVRLTSKHSISTAKKLVKAMIAAMEQQNKQKGAMHKGNLLKSGIRLDIAEIADDDIRKFAVEARRYGVLYTIVKDKTLGENVSQLMYRSNDKEKVNMIFKKLGRSAEYMAKLRESISEELRNKSPAERNEHRIRDPDAFLDELMRQPEPKKEADKKPEAGQLHSGMETPKDPTRGNLSRGSLFNSWNRRKNPSIDSSLRKDGRDLSSSRNEADPRDRKSVRKELAEIKEQMERDADKNRGRNASRTLTHNDPGKKKKPKKVKER